MIMHHPPPPQEVTSSPPSSSSSAAAAVTVGSIASSPSSSSHHRRHHGQQRRSTGGSRQQEHQRRRRRLLLLPQQERFERLLRKAFFTRPVLTHVFVFVAGFQAGLLANSTTNTIGPPTPTPVPSSSSSSEKGEPQQLLSWLSWLSSSSSSANAEQQSASNGVVFGAGTTTTNNSFVVSGMARVALADFVTTFDVGVPWDIEDEDNNDDIIVSAAASASASAASTPSEAGIVKPNKYNNNHNDDVLLLYTSQQSIPPPAGLGDGSSVSAVVPVLLSVREATTNCATTKVLITDRDKTGECLAIVGQKQSESYHLYKWVQQRQQQQQQQQEEEPAAATTTNNKSTSSGDRQDNNSTRQQQEQQQQQKQSPPRFSMVSRGYQARDGSVLRFPRPGQQRRNFDTLSKYLRTFNETLARLEPILQRAAVKSRRVVRQGQGQQGGNHDDKDSSDSDSSDSSKGAVVVMMCNAGQSELLLNFVCSANARNLDLSGVVVFATDAATVTLAVSLNLDVFDVQHEPFGAAVPAASARRHLDKIFRNVVSSKVYCAHLVNAAGYDVLFQDVDVVWYRHPFDFFLSGGGRTNRSRGSDDDDNDNNNNSNSNVLLVPDNYDMYFQDDGARGHHYGPYYPNSGLYYARYNERTASFFSVLLRSTGDQMLLDNDQLAIAAVLSEHVSLRGLKVKVFGRDTALGRLFPSGFHYLHRHDYMKRMIQQRKTTTTTTTTSSLSSGGPLLFHMTWTVNKARKIKHFQQMGDWFVRDSRCNGANDTTLPAAAVKQQQQQQQQLHRCCSAVPVVICHYRDLPSIIPCRDSPPSSSSSTTAAEAPPPSFW